MWLTRFTLRQPMIATLFFLAVAVFGLIAYFSMGENIIPNVNFPIVSVTAIYPGASPDEMERLIVRPIEDQIQGAAAPRQGQRDRARGHGKHHRAVQAWHRREFRGDGRAARRRRRALYLPNDLDPPLVEKFDVSAQPVLIEAITSKVLSPVDLSNVITNEIVPCLTRRQRRRQRGGRRQLHAPDHGEPDLAGCAASA